MKTFIRTLLSALAMVIVAGTLASAAPSFRAAFDVAPAADETSPSPEVSPSPEISPEPTSPPESPEVEPTETPSPEPSETSSPEPTGDVEGDSAAPDFSGCAGLTGLENAICRHEALLALRPDNPGLANALEHLVANLAKHTAKHADGIPVGDGETDGTADDGAAEGEVQATASSACPGKSCEPHGHGKANGHTKH